MNAKRYAEFFDTACKEPGTYAVTIGWKGDGGGHATIIKRAKDGTLSYIEPQVYDAGKGVLQSISELCNEGTFKPFPTRGVLRVDDKLFDVILGIVFQLQKYELKIDEIRFAKDEAVTLIMSGNEYRLGVRQAYDVQIAMIPDVAESLAKRDTEMGKTIRYDVNMEHVFDSDDEFYAKELGEEPTPTPPADGDASK